MSEEDALKLLDIKKGASIVEINTAFKKAVMKTHPDHGGSPEMFERVQSAKEKLVALNVLNHTQASNEVVRDKEDIKNVIVIDDKFLVIQYEEEFRAWRKPNMKIMGRLNANNKNKETEMVIDFCSKGYGGDFSGIERYLRRESGISSPYHMNERVLAIKDILDGFKEYLQSIGKLA